MLRTWAVPSFRSISMSITEGTKAYEAYEDEVVYERHRHRYEFNNQYRQDDGTSWICFLRDKP